MNLQGLIEKAGRIVFDHRKAWLIVFAVLTALFAASASRLTVDAGFNKMVPLTHPGSGTRPSRAAAWWWATR